MNTYQNSYLAFDGITNEEYTFLQQATSTLTDNQTSVFMAFYSNKRRNPQEIILAALLGFIGFSGVQRFITGQIGMGLLYFFTAGFFFIGTIIDLVNYKKLANDYNRQMAFESFNIAKTSN